MKRFMVSVVAVGAVLLLGGSVSWGHGLPGQDDADPDGNSLDAISLDTETLWDAVGQDPGFGGLIAAGTGADPTTEGYLFVDGNGSNPDPLDGYLGVSAADSNIVFDDDGHFHREGGNCGIPDCLPAPPTP